MTSAQHTPGPWTNHWKDAMPTEGGGRNKTKYDGFNTRAAGGHLIAEVWSTDKNYEANARLIAAAPELLQALEDMVRCYSQHGSNGVIGSACAAIKKAKATKGE